MTRNEKLKQLIVEELNLEDTAPEDIGDDMPLFEKGLELDSLDAVELAVQIRKHFGVEIKNKEEGRFAFQSVNTLSRFIEERMAG